MDRVDKVDRVEKVAKLEKVDKGDKADMVDKVYDEDKIKKVDGNISIFTPYRRNF